MQSHTTTRWNASEYTGDVEQKGGNAFLQEGAAVKAAELIVGFSESMSEIEGTQRAYVTEYEAFFKQAIERHDFAKHAEKRREYRRPQSKREAVQLSRLKKQKTGKSAGNRTAEAYPGNYGGEYINMKKLDFSATHYATKMPNTYTGSPEALGRKNERAATTSRTSRDKFIASKMRKLLHGGDLIGDIIVWTWVHV